MIKHILDTGVLTHYFRGIDPIFSIINEFEKEEVAITAITIAEFYAGFYRSPDGIRRKPSKDQLEMMKNALHDFYFIPFDNLVAHEYGKLKAKYAPDRCARDSDLMILASANIHNSVVVTLDKGFVHFDKDGNINLINQ